MSLQFLFNLCKLMTMKLQYLGHSSFFFKDKNASLITDPYDKEMVGLKMPKMEADIVTVSHQHQDHNAVFNVGGAPLVIDFPGEYERKGVRIYGYQTYHDSAGGAERGENLIFKIVMEEIIFLHLGDLGHLPENNLIEEIKDTDVLFVPVGGKVSLSFREIAKLTELIKPRITIPMHYNHPKMNQANFGDLKGVSDFLKYVGADKITPVEKLTLSADKLPEKEIIVMSC